MGKAREFLEFWIQTSVHAAEPRGVSGASQLPEELKARCIEMAGSQGLSLADGEAEVGDVYQHIKAALATANEEAVTHGVRDGRIIPKAGKLLRLQPSLLGLGFSRSPPCRAGLAAEARISPPDRPPIYDRPLPAPLVPP